MLQSNFKQSVSESEKNLKGKGRFSKKEIEDIFCTRFGARIKGITLRRDLDKKRYIILFHVLGSVYNDDGSKSDFVYLGEGAKGDQKLTAANKALIDSMEDGRPIYGFWQNEKGADYEYIGRLSVKKWEYVEDYGRKVYRYKMRSED